MTEAALRPQVSILMEKINALLKHVPSTDPAKISVVAEPVIKAFDLLTDDEKSECFNFLLGFSWRLYSNLSQQQGREAAPETIPFTWS